jgi:hypothetical protein
MEAAKRDDIEAVKNLVASSATLEVFGVNGDIVRVKDPRFKSADLNAKDKNGMTALFYANPPAYSLDNIVRGFLAGDGKVNALDVFHERFLEMAGGSGSVGGG